MQALLDFPHCVSSILTFVTIDRYEYLTIILHVLKPGYLNENHQASRIREIYEMYSYEVRKRIAIDRMFYFTTNANKNLIIKDDISEIRTSSDPKCLVFNIENEHRITHLSAPENDSTICIIGPDGDGFITMGRCNIKRFKNLKSLDTYSFNYVSINTDDIKVERLGMFAGHDLCKIPECVKHVSYTPGCTGVLHDGVETIEVLYQHSANVAIWEGMTHIGNKSSGPRRDAPTTITIQLAWFTSPVAVDLQASLLSVDIIIAAMVIQIRRSRPDGIFLPSIGGDLIDFSGATSESIYEINIKTAGRVAEYDIIMPAKSILGSFDCTSYSNIAFSGEVPSTLKVLHVAEVAHYELFKHNKLVRLIISLDDNYNYPLIIDQPVLVYLELVRVNTKKLTIRAPLLRTAIVSYESQFVGVRGRVMEMFGPKFHYTFEGTHGDKCDTVTAHIFPFIRRIRGDDRYTLYRNHSVQELRTTIVIVRDPVLYAKIGEHFEGCKISLTDEELATTRSRIKSRMALKCFDEYESEDDL